MILDRRKDPQQCGNRIQRYGNYTLSVLSVIVVACAGGIFNRFRGSDGGIFELGSMLSYWPNHVMYRGIMAIPTACVIQLFAKDAILVLSFLVVTWFSELVGWGTYFTLGSNAKAFTSRSGVYDWLVGRSQPTFDFSERWTRDYSAMMIRGMLWTIPAGYILYLRGYGWVWGMCGAMMPVIYSIGMNANIATPEGADDWLFSKGVPFSETIWGWWLWTVLLAVLLAKSHQTTRKRFRAVQWFEVVVGVFSAISLASIFFYASITQCDTRNFGQSLAGMVVPVFTVIGLQGWRLYNTYKSSHPNPLRSRIPSAASFGSNISSPRSIVVNSEDKRESRYGYGATSAFLSPLRDEININNTNSSTSGFNFPAPQENEPLLGDDDDNGDPSSSSALMRLFWPTEYDPVATPYVQLRNTLGIFSLLAVAIGAIVMLIGIGRSFHSDRICHNVLVRESATSNSSICLSQFCLDQYGWHDLKGGGGAGCYFSPHLPPPGTKCS